MQNIEISVYACTSFQIDLFSKVCVLLSSFVCLFAVQYIFSSLLFLLPVLNSFEWNVMVIYLAKALITTTIVPIGPFESVYWLEIFYYCISSTNTTAKKMCNMNSAHWHYLIKLIRRLIYFSLYFYMVKTTTSSENQWNEMHGLAKNT